MQRFLYAMSDFLYYILYYYAIFAARKYTFANSFGLRLFL